MRELPELWRGPMRVQWACVLMELLNENTLENIPLILSGFVSIVHSSALSSFSQAIRTTREILPHYTTRRAVQRGVQECHEYLYQEDLIGSYKINSESLAFSRVSRLVDTNVGHAKEVLLGTLLYRRVNRTVADPSREMSVRFSTDERMPPIVIPPIPFPVPQTFKHDMCRKPVGDIRVEVKAIQELALELDGIDAKHPEWRPRRWKESLHVSRLMAPRGTHLEEIDVLTLKGLKHLIGLPGSGKTTLLMLLGIYLARAGYRIALFFPSIEVARQYMETFHRYGTRVGMLVGQSPETRIRHAEHIAETIAAQGDGGFGHTIFGADRFAHLCVLPAFSTSETREGWQFMDAPCDRILQLDPGSKHYERRLCPLWSCCGRNKGPRELTSANLWVGHILSADTRVPFHAAEDQRRYFELIATTFDVVVFDECDMTQSLLDEHGFASLQLTGSEGSLHQLTIEQILARLAGIENYRLFDRRHATFSRQLTEFSIHNNMLIHILHRIDEKTSTEFENQLLTTSRVILEFLQFGKAFSGNGNRNQAKKRAKKRYDDNLNTRGEALTKLWDTSLYAAFFDRTGTADRPFEESDACARGLNLPVETLRERYRRLTRAFRKYLAEDTITGRINIMQEIQDQFAVTAFPNGDAPANTSDLVQLLTTLSFMILAFRQIAFSAREFVAQGFLHDLELHAGASSAMQHAVPVNILGSLSGVRYQYRQTYAPGAAKTIDVRYLVMTSTPRMLMHHFHELAGPDQPGPNVILTSATSFFEPSPAYHVPQGPHYVLSPRKRLYDPNGSRYVFRPVLDPATHEPLRYSGAGIAARRNLELMLDELVKGGTEQSEIYRQIRDLEKEHERNDGQGVGRKAALVVNSYQQVRDLMRFLYQNHREVARRTRGVVRTIKPGDRYSEFITPAMVENLGDDTSIDIVIFPMLAIGRGVNIVFSHGPYATKAAIGIVYFLTRPHPAADDLTLFYSIIARATQEMDAHAFSAGDTLTHMHQVLQSKRRETFQLVARLLQEPLQASRLGPRLFRAFTANTMVPVLQTIGRAMRGGSPVRVFFVDAAWAPASAQDYIDDPRSSMLVMMRALLEECLSHPNGVVRETYYELYEAFLEPLRRTRNLNFPAAFDRFDDPEENEIPIVGPSTMVLDDPDEFTLSITPEDALELPDFLEE